jgi:hypothetical protein
MMAADFAPPSTLRKGVPVAVDRWMRKALDPRLDKRFESSKEAWIAFRMALPASLGSDVDDDLDFVLSMQGTDATSAEAADAIAEIRGKSKPPPAEKAPEKRASESHDTIDTTAAARPARKPKRSAVGAVILILSRTSEQQAGAQRPTESTGAPSTHVGNDTAAPGTVEAPIEAPVEAPIEAPVEPTAPEMTADVEVADPQAKAEPSAQAAAEPSAQAASEPSAQAAAEPSAEPIARKRPVTRRPIRRSVKKTPPKSDEPKSNRQEAGF